MIIFYILHVFTFYFHDFYMFVISFPVQNYGILTSCYWHEILPAESIKMAGNAIVFLAFKCLSASFLGNYIDVC